MTQHKRKGSTLVGYDLYLDKQSNCELAFSPKRLHEEMRSLIAEVGMTHRRGLLDVWETAEAGPATSFHSLNESHHRVETWPDELHVNGDVQLCNYSRDNALAAKRFVQTIIERLQPAKAYVFVISRGPGPRPRLLEQIEWKRGTALPFKR